jgi:hypothetical protein
MKTEYSPSLRVTSTHLIKLLICILLGAVCGRSHATTLSGLMEFSALANGSFDNRAVWNTRGGDSSVNLWVVSGSSPNGPFINGPTDAQAAISIPLSPGTYTFSLLVGQQEESLLPYHALNLFFNGSNNTPGISVFAATQTNANPPFPPFSVGASSYTLSLSAQPVAAAGSLVFSDGINRVTLIDYRWAAASVYNIDRTTAPAGPGSTTPDGVPDWVGQFTLVVTSLLSNTPPVASGTISPVFELPGVTDLLVISPNGLNAEVVLDASQSTDSDNNPLQFSWTENGVSLATGVRTTNAFAVGTHTVTLVVSDGQTTDTETVTFEVITLSEGVAAVLNQIDSSDIPQRAKRPLVATLNSAISLLESGHTKGGINHLNALQHKISVQIARSNPELANTLIQAIQQILDAAN